MAEEDELIGRNVARYREPRSQADVAKAMRDRGWKWAQNTVSAVEQGERPLRLAEAIDLANILEVRNATVFARESNLVSFDMNALAAQVAHATLMRALKTYKRAQLNLAVSGDELISAGIMPTNEVVDAMESWLTMSAADSVLSADLYGDEQDVAATRAFVESVREGREDRGGNGRWMNMLFDLRVRENIAALEHLDVEHPEAP